MAGEPTTVMWTCSDQSGFVRSISQCQPLFQAARLLSRVRRVRRKKPASLEVHRLCLSACRKLCLSKSLSLSPIHLPLMSVIFTGLMLERDTMGFSERNKKPWIVGISRQNVFLYGKWLFNFLECRYLIQLKWIRVLGGWPHRRTRCSLEEKIEDQGADGWSVGPCKALASMVLFLCPSSLPWTVPPQLQRQKYSSLA